MTIATVRPWTRRAAGVVRPDSPGHDRRSVLITGGAGFVGTNLAHRLLTLGESVLLFDNLSRPGVAANVRWLRETHASALDVVVGDVCDAEAVTSAVRRASAVFHLAAQVAVTTSLEDPRRDFAVNAEGTLNILEALRAVEEPTPLVFTSTNKVYGGLNDLRLVRRGPRYEPADPRVGAFGISEERPLRPYSPYGCSKGAADQYVLDYARTFELSTVVFRMSCVYGPHQFGTTDQGWVAHFVAAVSEGLPVTLYGDGAQVRDLLFIDDLVQALLLARQHAASLRGQAFNIGGGPANAASVIEVLAQISDVCGGDAAVRHGDWRSGDQHYYVSDIRRFHAATGWTPRVNVGEGIRRLHEWRMATRSGSRLSAPSAGKHAVRKVGSGLPRG